MKPEQLDCTTWDIEKRFACSLLTQVVSRSRMRNSDRYTGSQDHLVVQSMTIAIL
eukprot:COSAG02_NODE_3293_length_6997_cov_1.765729_10_plen_55_part_00